MRVQFRTGELQNIMNRQDSNPPLIDEPYKFHGPVPMSQGQPVFSKGDNIPLLNRNGMIDRKISSQGVMVPQHVRVQMPNNYVAANPFTKMTPP